MTTTKAPKIEGWKLLGGSHKFPGPNGGTCINEAAVIARGFEYRSISSADDMPPCFSRVISQLALEMNDCFCDEDRNELLGPFIARLAGTKDRKHVEIRRLKFILAELSNERVQKDISCLNADSFLEFLEEYNLRDDNLTVPQLAKIHRKLCKMDDETLRRYVAEHKVNSLKDQDPFEIYSDISHWICINADPKKSVDVLEKAILMGKHENVANVELINQRMREYKEKAKEQNLPNRKGW